MQLPVRDAPWQIVHQCSACRHVVLHDRIKEAHCIAPGILGLVHRHIGMLKQFVHRLFIARYKQMPMLGEL